MRPAGSSGEPAEVLGSTLVGTVSIDDRSISDSLNGGRLGISHPVSCSTRCTISCGVSSSSASAVLLPGRSASVCMAISSSNSGCCSAAGMPIIARPLRSLCSRPGSSASMRLRLCGWSGKRRLQSRSSVARR